MLQQPLAVPGAGRRARRDNGANPWLHVEPPFLNQVLNDLVCGVGVDLQLGRERANRRERLTGLKLAADECLCRGKDHLVEDGLSGAKCESEQCHINNVTDVTVDVKPSTGPLWWAHRGGACRVQTTPHPWDGERHMRGIAMSSAATW